MSRRALALLALCAAGCARSAASAPSEPHDAPSAPSVSAPLATSTTGPAASAAPAAAAEPRPAVEPAPALDAVGKREVASTAGLVVSVETEATRAGVKALEAGGNAVDAAVAVAFVLAVTHPSAGNIGGGGFMLVRPKSGPTTAIDFRETAPAHLTRAAFDAMIEKDGIGAVAVGVPGSVRGLELAHQRFGKLPWADVVRPARKLAEKGHVVGEREGKTFGWNWRYLKKDRGAVAEFGPNPPQAGDRLRRPGLAKTLARIEKSGAAGFYEGPTAAAIVTALGKGGSQMTLDDLSSYRAKEREPLRFSYRGYELETMPPPSAGGVALMEILEQLERVGAWRSPAGSADDLHLFLEASRRAQIDKRFRVIDPDSLSSDELSRRLASFGDVGRLLEHGIDPKKATPSSELHPLYGAAMRELEHTTHFSVVDAGGMAVSCTTTLSAGFGAKLVVPGTGIVTNNAVASFATAGENLPTGGRRTVSSMAPTLVTRDGALSMVLGSPGGDTIPSTIAQVFRHLVDHGMPLDRAVDAPRVHHGFVPDEFRYESARPIPKSVIEDLKARGHHVSKKRLPMGDANDIVVVHGVARGYADRREGGLAAKASLAH